MTPSSPLSASPERAAAVLAALHAVLDPAVLAPVDERHLRDWSVPAAPGCMPLVLARPRDSAEVAAVLRVCHAHGHPVVPQGGLTGLTGGATPMADCVLLSLERMTAIEAVDPAGATVTVQAGATLQAVQEAAAAEGMMFALDIGARGSSLIGGNASTNAGGNRVLRFGMMRELVLGLEAVLPDGTVISAMNAMMKNNAGYDLKQLFIGSEGTLGVITRLVLRLHPSAGSTNTALCALTDYDAVIALLRRMRGRLGPTLSAFEAMWPDFYAFATAQISTAPPLPASGAIHVLVEAMGTDPAHDTERFEAAIAEAIEAGEVTDAVVAQSGREREAIWAVRDRSSDLRRVFSPHVDYDVSLPVGRIGAFVPECEARLRALWPQVGIVFFGHVADGNLHVSVQTRDGLLSKYEADDAVYGAVAEWQGSISAEHGIGLLKKAYLGHTRSEAEIALMRTLKAAIDPRGILNPGKVF